MSKLTNPPQDPIDALLFDCDGTLSHIEGINELARMNGVGETVTKLTELAMGSTGMNPELYQKRLELVRPTQTQVATLGELYFSHKAPDLLQTLKIFQALGKQIYIVSAGLYSAVADFAELLGINIENVFAVGIYFDAEQKYSDFDHQSPLVFENGKRIIAQQLQQRHTHLVHIGDGLSDLETYDLVTRFIGYGGAFNRPKVAQACDFYITTPTMAPLLPLCLTEKEARQLTGESLRLYQKGLENCN